MHSILSVAQFESKDMTLGPDYEPKTTLILPLFKDGGIHGQFGPDSQPDGDGENVEIQRGAICHDHVVVEPVEAHSQSLESRDRGGIAYDRPVVAVAADIVSRPVVEVILGYDLPEPRLGHGENERADPNRSTPEWCTPP